jgi:hypothetical protein
VTVDLCTVYWSNDQGTLNAALNVVVARERAQMAGRVYGRATRWAMNIATAPNAEPDTSAQSTGP